MKRFIFYGLDAPKVVCNLLIIGSVFILIPLTAQWEFCFSQTVLDVYQSIMTPARALLLAGISMLFSACAMLLSSLYGKYKQRDKIINMISWHGDEHVLDVGCGRGLMLIGTAKKLTTGKAVGIDKWQAEDLSGNTRNQTLANARKENVAEKIEVIDGDARSLPFEKESFDVILSSFVIHNIPTGFGRAKALQEILRVLKKDGTIIIQDFQNIDEYVEIFQELGCKHIDKSGLQWWMFPPAYILKVTK